MGAGKHTRSTLPAETEGYGNPSANKRQTGSSQSHRKVTVSSGRPSSPAFSLSFPVWKKASRIEKARGWELPSLISTHSTFQRESGLRREHQCSDSAPWHTLLRTLLVLHTSSAPRAGGFQSVQEEADLGIRVKKQRHLTSWF